MTQGLSILWNPESIIRTRFCGVLGQEYAQRKKKKKNHNLWDGSLDVESLGIHGILWKRFLVSLKKFNPIKRYGKKILRTASKEIIVYHQLKPSFAVVFLCYCKLI